MGSGKKSKKEKGEEKPSEKPSALRLILKFEGSSESNEPALNNVTDPSDESIQSANSLDKNSKKKGNNEKKKKKKKKKIKTNGPHNGNVSIVLEASELPVKDNTNKPETQSEREKRLGVPSLRQKQNKTPLQRLLDYLQQQLEDKDNLQVFAWPVTDQIAPGYSKVIKIPMDFSTMRQKIEDNAYSTLNGYVSDFQLMCNNAMQYNRQDTMYFKSAKRLLHSGIKFLSVQKLRQLARTLPLIKQIPPEQLGFDLDSGEPVEFDDDDDDNSLDESDEPDKKDVTRKRRHSSIDEVHGDLTPEQILELAQKSACSYDERQFLKRRKTTFSMGFLRQRQDGSTSLAIFVPGEGVDPERPGERVVTLGQLIGKLHHGTGQLQGFREHRRNIAKAVKPLNYGAFSSYAPSYDSTFANLSKEESDLVYETYGEETSGYVDNVLNLAKVCDYTLVMVDNLLDLMTGGEYRKSKNVIDEQKKFQEEEERVRELIENKGASNTNHPDLSNTKIEFDQLKTLSELGIDTSFLKEFEEINEHSNPVQAKLDSTSQLLEKLQQVQNDRLSAPQPSHLSQISHPSDTELNLADKIIESLTEMAKQAPPAAIIPVPGIRKAMGVVPDTADGSTNGNGNESSTTNMDAINLSEEETSNSIGVADLDSDIRDFLENNSSMNFSVRKEKNVEEMQIES
ncbi:bromodomain-containing protein 7 [Halyomorpha halys]|uniref:bromodomain-containing protein 7 n=1 Tax=Halyomorpha halys TaxID=286706 RepID=UPI0006D4DF14|nr:bromodomain-containing protein 7-like [Halyomorpha halys]XP_024215597.1 bromodomain-containing protein 7-like [Halyomorpha halys]